MYKSHWALAAILPALLVGCGSSGGGGSNIRPDPPPAIKSSIDGVPAEHQTEVKKEKTFNPMATIEGDLGKWADENNKPKWVIKKITLNDQVLPANGEYSFSELQDGLNKLKVDFDYGEQADALSVENAKGSLYIYQQPYSIVMGSAFTEITGPLDDGPNNSVLYIDDIKGLKTASTAIDNLAAEGTFTYTGVAFNGQDVGSLTYDVDFVARTGSGQITGITETGTIDLQTASIANLNLEFVEGMGIDGKADFANDPGKDINYRLGFFGPNAEEIAGRIGYTNDADNTGGISEVGFGGKR